MQRVRGPPRARIDVVLRLRRSTKAPRKRGRIRKLRLLAVLTVLVLLAGTAFTFGLVRAVASEIPLLDPSAQRSQVDGVIYASNGRSVLAVLRGDESRVLLDDIGDVSPIMRQAIVSVEDHRFYEHNGVDTRGILRALWSDIRSQGVVEGGSTITQQFVKNAYVRNQRTIARKVREAALAWQLEQRWSKDRILLAYLNTIYFGNGAYGIQQAAQTYFGKGARRLTLVESALLAGLPADPSLYDPVRHPRAAMQRRRYVLQTMVDQGKITARQFQTANRAPLPKPDDVRLPGTQGPGQYFANYVKDQLIAKYGAGRVFGGGLKVTSTIDLRAAGDRSPGDRERPQDPRRAGRGPRRDRPAHRRGAGDGRRLELPQEPVQPRDAGGAAARLVVQALRPRNGPAPGHLAHHDVRVQTRRHRRRRPGVARHELRRRLPRPRRPGPSHGLLRQLRLLPADEARRAEGDREDRPRARDPERARSLLLDRARLRGGEPARHDTRLRDLREPRARGSTAP